MPPTSSAPKPERDNLQWVKLKTYITNRRNEEIQEKEKEEELAKKRKLLEEEYLKTKEELEKVQKEISEKNTLLKQYGDEKHELFSQLKKVLLDDDNRKRLESEKNEHTLLLNNLNHSNQAQIFISQAPMSNSTIQPIPLNSSSSIYKLPMATATVIPTPHSINNKRTHSPAPLPTSIAVQQPQLHPSYAAYKHPIPGNATMFSAQQQMKLNEEQQKHIVLSQQQQQQQLRQQHQQASQQHQQQQQSSQQQQQQQQGRGGPMSHHQQQAQNNEYIQRNIMNWQQQQQMNSNAKNTAGGAYPHYFPPGQPHVPTSQYQQPRSTDSKPAPIFLHQQQHHQQQPPQQQHQQQQQQQQQHQQRSAYDDKYHFQLRLPNQHGGPPPVSSAGSNQHPSPKGGSITAGYPIRGLPGTRVVASMVPNNVTYHQQNMHKFIPHSQSGSNNK